MRTRIMAGRRRISDTARSSGAEGIAVSVQTPWGDRNQRFKTKDGMQLTLFQVTTGETGVGEDLAGTFKMTGGGTDETGTASAPINSILIAKQVFDSVEADGEEPSQGSRQATRRSQHDSRARCK